MTKQRKKKCSGNEIVSCNIHTWQFLNKKGSKF